MLFRSTHSIYHNGYSRDDIHAEFLYGTPDGARVQVQRSKHQATIVVTFQAREEDEAVRVVDRIKREATMRWSADHLGLSVKARNGWEDVDLTDTLRDW